MIHIMIDVDSKAEPDIIGIKECFVMDAERYGDIRGVRVTADITPYEQMQLAGLSREEFERIVREGEEKRQRIAGGRA